MLPDKLARQSAVLVAHPEIDFVLSDYEHFDSKGALPESKARQWEPEGHGMLFQQSGQDLRVLDPLTSLKAFVKRPGLALSCSSYFFRKDLWRRVGGFDHQYMPVADYDFLLRAVDKPIVWLDRVLFRKRVHDSNHWRSYVADPARKWRSEQSVARAQRAMLKRVPRDPILRTLVANHSGYVASGFIGIGEYTAALGEAMQLLKLRNVRNAACILARLLASAARRGRKAASKADSAAHHAAGL